MMRTAATRAFIARDRMLRNADAHKINEISRMANEYQSQTPGMARSEALRLAEQILASRRESKP